MGEQGTWLYNFSFISPFLLQFVSSKNVRIPSKEIQIKNDMHAMPTQTDPADVNIFCLK